MIVTPNQEIEDSAILIEDEKIAWVGNQEELPLRENAEIMDLKDNIIIPGFIDIHFHGYGGHTVCESPEALATIARHLTKCGTTSFLPTIRGISGFDSLVTKLKQVGNTKVIEDGANVLGIHMEGPFLSPEEPAIGSQSLESLRLPSVSELVQMQEAANGAIRYMTIAPELNGAIEVIKEMVRQGIVPSAGHSNASYEEVGLAVEFGLRSATHFYNGMPSMHHRSPGLVGAALTMPELNVELIGDGMHVGKVAMEILFRCKGPENVVLVSDNTEVTGLPDGIHRNENGAIRIIQGRRCVTENGRLSGSVMPMNEIVRNVMRTTSCSFSEVIKMATLNPALLICYGDKKGSIAKGKDADLVVVDRNLNVKLTIVKGKIVFYAN